MPYEALYSKPFNIPVFIRDNNYWENYMLPSLCQQGWHVVIVDCAGVVDAYDFAIRFMNAISFDWSSFPHEFDLKWAEEYAEDIHWLDMRQGLFVYYKNFEDVLSMADGLSMEGYVRYSIDILYIMNAYYPRRPMWRDDEYEVLFGYGLEVSKDSLPRVEEYFEGHEIIFAGPDTEYPWSQQEERKKKYFPNGFPDPRYDENGIWITDPDIYPESATYTNNNDVQDKNI